jgi:hypothetical protein
MPITINVGLNKEVGTANYGSLGASCNVEFEAEHDLLNDFAAFHEQVKDAFAMCRQAVQNELAREQAREASNDQATNDQQRPPGRRADGNGNRG